MDSRPRARNSLFLHRDTALFASARRGVRPSRLAAIHFSSSVFRSPKTSPWNENRCSRRAGHSDRQYSTMARGNSTGRSIRPMEVAGTVCAHFTKRVTSTPPASGPANRIPKRARRASNFGSSDAGMATGWPDSARVCTSRICWISPQGMLRRSVSIVARVPAVCRTARRGARGVSAAAFALDSPARVWQFSCAAGMRIHENRAS